MSFLGRRGPINIPEGEIPVNMEAPSFGRGLFRSIVLAAREKDLERRRRSKNRMAGQADNRRRYRLRGERRPKPDIGVGGGLGIPPKFPKGPRSPRGYLPYHRRTNDAVTTPGFPSDDNRRREVTTPGFPSDEKPRIRPPFRRSNDDINVGFGLIKNPRRKRRRRKGKKDLSEYDFTIRRPKFGIELIPKDKK